ncbi:hypothetical protein SAMN02745216_02842 [Desulfatibacillum alkenivorans DSM 16219]|uniref:Coiled coil domain-containing protein n=1 Tax=Desulfatibacillum alkenivorans DSM 16219 TaxID=1121393 RepID=A0A1M6PI32_9BACT|nr:hypothetical protein [Desulfatibacillum alkenivorans]SHK07582.1 hypothetical protein SAMN02745216_02842 [Desulfatibacillum alkenivorans DSM 16219]
MEKKDAYVVKMQAKLDEWSADIDRLEAKAKNAKADAQINYREQIEELQARRKLARERLMKMRESGTDAWADLKTGFEQAVDSLGDAIKAAKSRF